MERSPWIDWFLQNGPHGIIPYRTLSMKWSPQNGPCPLFKLIFVWCTSRQVKVHLFWIWVSNFSSSICWKDCPFLIELLLHLCEKSVAHVYGCLSLSSRFCSMDLCVSPQQYNIVRLTMALQFLQLHHLFQVHFVLLLSLLFLYTFKN